MHRDRCLPVPSKLDTVAYGVHWLWCSLTCRIFRCARNVQSGWCSATRPRHLCGQVHCRCSHLCSDTGTVLVVGRTFAALCLRCMRYEKFPVCFVDYPTQGTPAVVAVTFASDAMSSSKRVLTLQERMQVIEWNEKGESRLFSGFFFNHRCSN